MDPSEAPRRVHGDDGGHLQPGESCRRLEKEKLMMKEDARGYQLRSEEGGDQQKTRAFDEGPAPRPGDEDERLTYDTHLEVESCRQLVVVVPDRLHSKFLLFRSRRQWFHQKEWKEERECSGFAAGKRSE